MYELTLTSGERQAMNWVGYRYNHGDCLKSILLSFLPEGVSWYDDTDITFNVPESDAWDILIIANEGNYAWDCFDDVLASKLTTFAMEIV